MSDERTKDPELIEARATEGKPMRLNYGTAVVGFCPDLTSGESESIPVAALLVGKTGDGPVAAVTWRNDLPEEIAGDPISAALLRNLPELLRGHVDDALDGIQSQEDGIDDMLNRLRNMLRNSLHVSRSQLVQEVDVADADEEFAGDLFRLLSVELANENFDKQKKLAGPFSGCYFTRIDLVE